MNRHLFSTLLSDLIRQLRAMLLGNYCKWVMLIWIWYVRVFPWIMNLTFETFLLCFFFFSFFFVTQLKIIKKKRKKKIKESSKKTKIDSNFRLFARFSHLKNNFFIIFNLKWNCIWGVIFLDFSQNSFWQFINYLFRSVF